MMNAAADDMKVATLAGALPPHCRQDVDTLRRFVRSLVDDGMPAAPGSPLHFREVLLTGATGFLGRYVLRDLLCHDAGLVVHCVIRAADDQHGLERLRRAMQEAEIWDEAFASRTRVVVGDVTAVRFGLSEADFDVLCDTIDAVYHFAADVNLASSYLAIRKANVFSTRNVIELCLRKRCKHLFYASTMGVFPQAFCGYSTEFGDCRIEHQMQPDLASMKRMFPIAWLGYPWSKLVSEQALLFAHAAGVPLAVFRLPRTGTAGTGHTNPHDATVRILAAIVEVELMPRGFTIQGANEAVDTLSRLCTAISMNPWRRSTIYHCCNPQPDYHDIELADTGLNFPEVSYQAFKRACTTRGEHSPLHGYWALLDHFEPYWFNDRRALGSVPVCDRAIREDCPDPIRWPSMFTMVKRSNDWIRRHRQTWPYPVPQSRLEFDCLMTRANRHADDAGVPFESTYPAQMRLGLRQLVQALNAPDAGLLEDRLGDVVFDLCWALRNIAALAGERRHHPEIDGESIDRPVFIVGINRTGTTYLHRLMARDPRFWALRNYEFMEPVLSGGQYATVAGTLDDPRRTYFEEVIESSGIRETFAGIHHIDIDEPEEDFPILRLAFAAWTLTVRYHVPAYGRWLADTGSRHAYDYHRRTMQHYSWQRRQREPGVPRQWLFKMPGHLMELEALLEAYPDALFIQTHRDPKRFMGSWNNMVERIRSRSSEPRPREEFGAEQLAFMSGMLNKAVQFREFHPEIEDRWVDVNYFDLVQNPIAIVHHIYDRFGWTLGSAARVAMEDWQLRQAEKRRSETRHRYDLQDFGLAPEAVDEAFAPYREFVTARGIRESRL